MPSRHKNIDKVEQFLRQHETLYQICTFPDTTRTAEDAARVIGCRVEQIAKSLIFRNSEDGNPLLIIASGGNRVSLEKFQQTTNLKLVNADAKFAKHHTGFPIGGVPPIAHKESIKTYLDRDLLNFDIVWASAGTPDSVFSIQPAELGRLTEGEWLEVKA